MLTVGLGAVAVGYLVAFVDSRAPLLVADEQGARLRLGRTWLGLPWSAVERIEHLPRRGLLRDGRLVLVPEDADTLTAGLDARGRRQLWLSRRLYGAPFAVPLGLATRVTGAETGLDEALGGLAPERVREPRHPASLAGPASGDRHRHRRPGRATPPAPPTAASSPRRPAHRCRRRRAPLPRPIGSCGTGGARTS